MFGAHEGDNGHDFSCKIHYQILQTAKAQSKETMIVQDKSTIQFAVETTDTGGIVYVLNRGNSTVGSHFNVGSFIHWLERNVENALEADDGERNIVARVLQQILLETDG